MHVFKRRPKVLRYLHISRHIDKYLDKLRMRGRQGVLAATQYQHIIESLRQEEWCGDALNCKRTKKGEYRLKNCVKYDLGHGYRLVTVKDGDNLFVTFVGSHDQTDRWIETHRYDVFCADESLYNSEIIEADETVAEEPLQESLPQSAHVEPNEYEARLADKIDDVVLKTVFSGLFG